MTIKKLSIILPVYNEEKTVCKILDKIKDVILLNKFEKELIIVMEYSS